MVNSVIRRVAVHVTLRRIETIKNDANQRNPIQQEPLNGISGCSSVGVIRANNKQKLVGVTCDYSGIGKFQARWCVYKHVVEFLTEAWE